MNNPLVSILIPVYNREILLAECIESALSQTVGNLEVIVVDNASQDRSWEICQRFAAQDPRVRIFRNDSNIGPVRNWKRCLDEAQGVYGKFLFSDDLLASACLEKMLPFLMDADIGFVFSSFMLGNTPAEAHIACKHAGHAARFPSSRFVQTSLYKGNAPVSPGCALFRLADLKKNMVLEVPSPTLHDFLAHGGGIDLSFYLLTTCDYPFYAYLDEPLCFFRSHAGSITVSDKNRHLYRYYLQTKIRFAENHFSINEIRYYYLHAWFHTCRERKHWVWPSIFLRDFTEAYGSVGVFALLGFFLKRLSRKLFNPGR